MKYITISEKYFNEICPNKNIVFCLSCKIGEIEFCKTLLSEYPEVDPSADNNKAFRLASEYGQIEVVKWLLQDERVNPFDDDNYAIRWATKNNHPDVVALILNDPRMEASAFKYFTE